jgi:radical SAM protein
MSSGQPAGDRYPGLIYADAPRNVYWEMTIACDLACKHCRADALHARDPLELNGDEARAMLRDIKGMGSMVILTGGDPMQRPDLFDLIEYGRSIDLPVSITPSTTPTLTREVVRRFKELGVAAMGVSLDAPDAQVHDAFRGVDGTFERSQAALAWAREFKIPVQVNTTVTTGTMPHLPALFELLKKKHAPPVRRWSLFLLVPVGRGVELGIPTADRIEELFGWVYAVADGAPFHVGTVEAPHYRRYWIQRKEAAGMPPAAIAQMAKRMGFGVRDGNGVIFVSHRGEVYPAGFLPHPLLGNVRETPLSEIYRVSPALLELRDMSRLKGACGACVYRWACGGSRARAWAMTGDTMGSDPFCTLAVEPAASAA